MDVYPNRAGLWAGAIASAMCAIGCCVAIALARVHDGNDLIIGASAILLGIACGKAVQQLRTHRPILRLNMDGLEGSFGYVAWRDVESVDVRWCWDGLYFARRVVLLLREGRSHLAPKKGVWPRSFLVGGAGDAADRIEFPAWAHKRTILRTLQPYATESGVALPAHVSRETGL